MKISAKFQMIKFTGFSLIGKWKIVLLIVILGSNGYQSFAQSKLQDSLKTKLAVQESAKDSCLILSKMVRINLQSYPDSAIKYLKMLKKFDLEEIPNDFEVTRMEAQLWKKKKDFSKSSNLYKKCISEEVDVERQGQCHFGLADNYLKQGALDLAIEHLLDAIDIFAILSKKGRLSSSYNKLGRCFDEAGYNEKAINAYEQALKIQYESGNKKGAMQVEKNLGDTFIKDGRRQESVAHYDKAYLLAKELKANYMIHALHLAFAQGHLDQNNPDSANHYAMKAYKFFDIQKNNYPSMINARIVLGDIRFADQKLDEAIDFYDSALGLSRERKRTYQIIQANKRLSQTYEAKKLNQKAIYHLKKATMLNDSVIHMESQRRIITLNEAYDSEKKDIEIISLNSQNSIQKLELSRSRIQTLFAMFGAVGVGLLAYLFYRSLKVKRQSEKVLSEKNKIISSALADKELLLKEIHHRVKNNLQIVSSLLGLQSEYIKDDSALIAINEGRNRVRSMALIHQNLYKEDNLTGISIKSYLEKLISGLFDTYNLDSDSIKLILSIEDINLDIDTVVPMGLIANELVSNALKHAFPDQSKGELTVGLFEENGQLIFTVKDNGIGMDVSLINDEMSTFGFQMIQAFKEKMQAELIVVSAGGTSIKLIMKNYNIINGAN